MSVARPARHLDSPYKNGLCAVGLTVSRLQLGELKIRWDVLRIALDEGFKPRSGRRGIALRNVGEGQGVAQKGIVRGLHEHGFQFFASCHVGKLCRGCGLAVRTSACGSSRSGRTAPSIEAWPKAGERALRNLTEAGRELETSPQTGRHIRHKPIRIPFG